MSQSTGRPANRDYIRPMPVTWWLGRKTYVLFMVRELTSVFVGAYAVLLLIMVCCAQDRAAFDRFYAWLTCPLAVVLHLVALSMAMYHSITWFNLTPKVMVIFRGEERVSPVLIAGANYVVWIALSALVAWWAFLAG